MNYNYQKKVQVSSYTTLLFSIKFSLELKRKENVFLENSYWCSSRQFTSSLMISSNFYDLTLV